MTEAAGLADAARRYAAALLAPGHGFAPDRAAEAERFFALLPSTDTGDGYRWARFLAGWPGWHPVALERRLCMPPRAELTRAAVGCRAAAGRRLTVGTPSDVATAADLLDAVSADPPPAARATLERAAAIGCEVAARVAALPPDWTPVRIVRVVGRWADDWPGVTSGADDPFLDLLAIVLDAMPTADPAELFGGISEAFPDLSAAGLLPTTLFAAAGRLSDARPADAREWAAFVVAAGSSPGGWAARLARLAYRAAVGRTPGLVPPLDPATLTVPPTYTPPPDATVRYVRDPHPPRRVVAVDRFAVPPAPPSVVVSVGREGGEADWLLFDQTELRALPPGGWEARLAARRGVAEVRFWGRDSPAEPGGWAEWLATEQGEGWLTALAADDTPAGGRLLAALLREPGVRCFPSPGPAWPAGLPFVQPGAMFATGPEPVGTVAAVERYAPQPAAARFTVSLGPNPTSPVALAAAVRAAIPVKPSAAPLARAAADALERLLRTPAAADTGSLLAVLDALVDVAPADVLAAVRRWAAALDCRVLPESDAVADAAGDAVAVRPVFRRDVPAGASVRVRAFGLRDAAGRVVRPAEVVVSAGPPPAGFNELEALAAGCPEPVGAALRDTLAAFRPAGAGGYLEQAAVDLHVRYWDDARTCWATFDPTTAEAFAVGCREMLAAAFGLAALHPVNYRDYPAGWVSVPAGTRMVSGRVTRTLRPGLVTASGTLRLPARVEAE